MTKHRINPEQTHFARALRHQQTDAEQLLWRHLRGKQLGGYRFRRQHPIKQFVADFVCIEASVIIELDGGQHAEQTNYDSDRTAVLEELGFRVARFWNHQVLQETNAVLEEILRLLSLNHLPPPQPSPCEGEGDENRNEQP